MDIIWYNLQRISQISCKIRNYTLEIMTTYHSNTQKILINSNILHLLLLFIHYVISVAILFVLRFINGMSSRHTQSDMIWIHGFTEV